MMNDYFEENIKDIEEQAKIAELNKKMQLSLVQEDGGEMDTSGIPLDAYPVQNRDGGNGKYYYYRGWFKTTELQKIKNKKQAFELASIWIDLVILILHQWVLQRQKTNHYKDNNRAVEQRL